jgi:hypothetical protein
MGRRRRSRSLQRRRRFSPERGVSAVRRRHFALSWPRVIGQLPALFAMLVVGAGDATSEGAATPDTPPSAQPHDDLPIAIVWNAPAECPGLDALKGEVRRVAGPVSPPSEPLSAEATVRRGPGTSWQLTLTTRAGARAGERRLAGADCGELMHAAALVMALMINPQASIVPEPPPPPTPPPLPPPIAERRYAAGADVVVGSGALPGIAPGIGLRFAAAAGALSAELRASIWASRSTESSSAPGTGGSFNLVDGAIAGCARARRARRLSPGVCVGASIVRLHGTGYGITDPGADAAWWSVAFAEANLRIRLTPSNAVRLAAQGLVPLGRPTFALGGVGQVFEPASFWLRGTLGWELHF